jgi:hypothetical protein
VEWQLLPVMLIVAIAAWYLGRVTWRSWRGGKGNCGGGCHCGSAKDTALPSNGSSKLIPSDQLLTRLRRRD